MRKNQDIVGKWLVIADPENQRYRVGQVTQRIGEYHWIVRIRSFTKDLPVSSVVLGIDHVEDQMIFDDEVSLDAWLAWADKEENGPKVVAMREK